MPMEKNGKSRGSIADCKGFSLIEVLLGISVFMIGMLGVTALNVSSLKSNTFSGNLSEATLLASAKIEELLATDFDDIVSGGTNGNAFAEDENKDGMDDDDDADTGNNKDGTANFGLDIFGAGADGTDTNQGKKHMYTVYWNVADSKPIIVTPSRTKTINVIVEWFVKDEPRRISMQVVRTKEE